MHFCVCILYVFGFLLQKKQIELGDRMDLNSYLLKPVQRMGKYALLLKQIIKECAETDPEYNDLCVSITESIILNFQVLYNLVQI